MNIYIDKIVIAVVLLSIIPFPLWGAGSGTDTELQDDSSFCRYCHIKEADDIAEAGMAHLTEITCSSCHAGHKPKSFENIPRCSLCHSETAHYDQLQCLNCHRNPHRPLEIKLPKKAYAECLTCHEIQGEELTEFPSYHSTLVCTDCHHEHGELPECLSCHKSHAVAMAEESCQSCHDPHKPLDIVYADDVPISLCSPCHGAIVALLEQSQREHGKLNCTKCHINQHGRIPACEDCHGTPHANAIHKKFPTCSECHGAAHDLE